GERHSDAPRGLRIALGSVPRALLVAALDVANARVVEGVVGREIRSAGDAEYGVDTLSLQAFHDCLDRSQSEPPFKVSEIDSAQARAPAGKASLPAGFQAPGSLLAASRPW